MTEKRIIETDLPYEKLVNERLGRTLTQQEINAVKIFVEYANAISPSDSRYDNAVRDIIVGGNISNVLTFVQNNDYLSLTNIQ